MDLLENETTAGVQDRDLFAYVPAHFVGRAVGQYLVSVTATAPQGELIAEVSASHTYIFGGDLETPLRRQIGLLGVDWTIEDGAYRIERIVRGAPWNNEARSPIDESGVEIS